MKSDKTSKKKRKAQENPPSDSDDDKNEDSIAFNIAEPDESIVLPSGQEVHRDRRAPPDLGILEQRIQDTIHILGDFKNLGADKPRSQYIEQLVGDLASYYSYSEEIVEYFLNLFSPAETLEFFTANEVNRPMTIRTNTLKTRRRDLAQALINRGVNLEPVEWSSEALRIEQSQVPVGATPEYLAGHYMLQSASSLLPVLALAPKLKDRILDMCAAPGGKTSHIASLLRNTGVVVANEQNKLRLKSLIGNIHRLGVENSFITHFDGRKLKEHFSGQPFDRVLLDAPCSGLGVISKDPTIKLNKTMKDIYRCSHMQKELILAAIDLLEPSNKKNQDGTLVYSTCSVAPEENESVINYALNKRNVRVVETGLEIGVSGFVNYRNYSFHPSVKHCRRIYPHIHNLDGFFIAKLEKYSNGTRDKEKNKKDDNKKSINTININEEEETILE